MATPVRTRPSPSASSEGRAPKSVIFALCSILTGITLTERISDTVLPLTLSRFTTSATIIGLVLAIHPVFGFVVQPIIGVISDRVWTPIGQRAVFFVVGAPTAALCLVFVPQALVFGQLVALVVAYQFFQEMQWGAEHPLLAALVPPYQRTLVRAYMVTTAQIGAFVFLKFGLGWAMARFGEALLYRIAAGAQILLIAMAALFLKEKRMPRVNRGKLTPKRYLLDLCSNPILRRFSLLAFTHGVFINVIAGFVVLFAVRTVGVSKAEFGKIWSVQTLSLLLGAIPLAALAERWPKQWALVLGYGLALVACILGYLAKDAANFFAIAIFFGVGSVMLDVTLKPFFSEYLPLDLLGQLSGAFNFCSAVGRSLALAAGGLIVSWFNDNYRVIWAIALVFGVLSAVIAGSLPDLRHRKRSALRAAS